MKSIFVIILVVAATQGQETYSTENDNLDIESVVANLDTLKSFNGCFVDKVVCDPVAADFKKDIAEAVAEACAKCTAAQKHIFKIYMAGLKEKLPQDYEAFKAKYDSEGKHFAALEKAVAAF